MKDIKCPLCGGNLEMVQVYMYESVDSPGCLNCGYQLLDKDAIESARRNAFPEGKMFPNDLATAKEFVSKFPPIMRVQMGDMLEVYAFSEYSKVLQADNETCRIRIEDPKGDKYIIDPTDVCKWPWELEQKGGQDA